MEDRGVLRPKDEDIERQMAETSPSIDEIITEASRQIARIREQELKGEQIPQGLMEWRVR